ncbi:DUF6888 family protein [uncultured Nostoc sp.]|uniref:DUF6888 family protein n=1 Tax=uncultured Nostoc sp. TaxID=340711 RepID=UPI0035CBA1E3
MKPLHPTIEQLETFYRVCVRTSNLLRTIELTRYDTRSQRIVVLIGETIQVEILSNGEELIQ